ncbi:MAG: adenosine deaminase [Elusimicrobia bacterium CG08_land_8_20_14_0_20_51_18]|nr:MAG: adenosine deaminase [Elusimicrobia bacterium CG08_land_8_20_14_0_20_51_18]
MKKEIHEHIRAMPKAELHRHLEGCVSVPAIIRLARKHRLPLPTFDEKELEKTAKLHAPMASLPAVLKMFAIAQSVFVSYEALEEITFEALDRASRLENIKLLELRYSPDFMLGGKDLDWKKALEVIAGTLKKFERSRDLVGGIILIGSRSYGLDSVLKTADFALENKKLVIGFDLADDETAYPSRLYAGAAKKLREGKIPLTVHSGEEGSYEQVIETVETLSPRRIGHGVKAAEDPSGLAIKMIKEGGITVEANPWSNYLTNSVPSLEKHPLKKFLDAGLKVCIGADDPEILDTDLNKEYRLAVEKLGFSEGEIRRTLEFALEGSFLEKDKKQQAAKALALT